MLDYEVKFSNSYINTFYYTIKFPVQMIAYNCGFSSAGIVYLIIVYSTVHCNVLVGLSCLQLITIYQEGS